MQQFSSDLTTHRFRDKVRAAKQAAGRYGVRNAPAFFIDGKRLQGPPLNPSDLLAALERAERSTGSADR